MTLTWLEGGTTAMDGGAMFGVVPKPLWSRKYPFNENNQIELPTDPILIQYQGKNILIDAGIGKGKLTEKQRKIFGVSRESEVEESLAYLGLTTADIDSVLMTHLHFDHASGLTKQVAQGEYVPVFERAEIIVNAIEWEEMQSPNIRSKSTYWDYNWQPIIHQVKTYEEVYDDLPGIQLIHSGGHSKGHAVVKLQQEDRVLLHMADIMPTHAHQNPLWVLAYDDYPMTSIFAKEKWMNEAKENDYGFIFYHDAFYRMVKWDAEGKEIVTSLKRSRTREIK
ncbi:MBL fold metallo-hydrolase [Vagococcus xieshaowenii]|uniref:MBL fold metallo-hydrolase n=2 Tax=Vagococcus xieshaowenii TaxID=2562451 RepID=A0AAJ5EFD5_9ENTE|nr:MBL fold metallo-hydrolase [Vagococcus xieshaowenii]TFZ40181.1 MBL fold metallo-hydrolase [Vagococcus xieshaowenii]